MWESIEMTAWESIETAPRDSTPILIFVPGGYGMFVVRWVQEARRLSYRAGRDPKTKKVIVIPQIDGAWVAGGDIGCDETIEFYGPPGPYPTHWHVLPPPPGDEG